MLKQMGTWKSRWKILALAAVFFIGAATLADARETKPKMSAAEIQAKIDRLQIELRNAKEAENETPSSPWLPVAEVSPARMKTLLVGRYIGTEGDDRIGIVLEQPKDGVYPITIYEDGLPRNGYDPTDDDKYIGTATLGSNEDGDLMWLDITLKQKFDGAREKRVEPALREFNAAIELKKERDGLAVSLAIRKNKEWDAIHVSKEKPAPPKTTSTPSPNADSLAGRYLGWEGDDELGMILTQSQDKAGHYDTVFYEDGLPGAGHDPGDDERYEGVAVLKDGLLAIRLTKKFDEGREEPVERALQRLKATVATDKNGNVKIDIPRNNEWDAVRLTKQK